MDELKYYFNLGVVASGIEGGAVTNLVADSWASEFKEPGVQLQKGKVVISFSSAVFTSIPLFYKVPRLDINPLLDINKIIADGEEIDIESLRSETIKEGIEAFYLPADDSPLDLPTIGHTVGTPNIHNTSDNKHTIEYILKAQKVSDGLCLGLGAEEIPLLDIPGTTLGDLAIKLVNVKEIGKFSFSSVAVSSLVIPDSVIKIDEGAFYRSDLETITLPAWLNTIETGVFAGCVDLTAVILPEDIITIKNSAFEGCESLTSIILPDRLKYLGKKVFHDCTSLTNINIPDRVTLIDEATFKNSGLTSIVIPNKVTSIGSEAFNGCDDLTSVTISNKVTLIEDRAFRGCVGITEIEIPNSVLAIEESAFRECTGLTSIEIPNSVTSIGNSAFSSCTGLTTVTISSSVTSIGDGVFNGCSNLASIVVEDGNTTYDSRNNCNAVIETATNKLIVGCKTTVIPASVTFISSYSFSNRGLTSVTIPDNVITIDGYAFHLNNGLAEVNFGTGVAAINYAAFGNCTSLATLTLRGTTPPVFTQSTFSQIFSDCPITKIYVPADSVDTYKAADGWSDAEALIEAIPAEEPGE